MARGYLFGLLAVGALAVPAAHGLSAPEDVSARPPVVVAQQKPPAAAPVKLDPAVREAGGRIAGPFQLTSADGGRACSFGLKADPSGPGLGLDFSRDACAVIAFSAQVVAWLPDPSGSIRLLNAQGRTVAEFTEGAGGSYEALREGDGVYFLTNPSAADSTDLKPEEVVGEWDLARTAGTPVCRITLLEDAAPGGGHRLKVAPGCDDSLMRFRPLAWDIEGGNILVRGEAAGAPIRFARQEDGGWARTPERGRPLLMTRP